MTSFSFPSIPVYRGKGAESMVLTGAQSWQQDLLYRLFYTQQAGKGTPDLGLSPNELFVEYLSCLGLRLLASPGVCCPELTAWLNTSDTVESPFMCQNAGTGLLLLSLMKEPPSSKSSKVRRSVLFVVS